MCIGLTEPVGYQFESLSLAFLIISFHTSKTELKMITYVSHLA